MEIHSISKSVTLFSLMLKQVGQALQASDSVHSSEALETAQEISNECQMVFDEIKEMLDKVTSRKADGSSSPSIQQRFRWCFKKGRVQYLLAQLESLKMSLLVMLQILQLGKLMTMTPKRYAWLTHFCMSWACSTKLVFGNVPSDVNMTDRCAVSRKKKFPPVMT